MSAVLLPGLLAAAGLLALSAVAKLRRPDPAAAALGELGLPAARTLVRGGSLVELAVAALAVARPAAGAPAACVLFLGFAVLVTVQLRRGSTRSCGCLGAAELPPTPAHAVVNLLLAVVAGAAAGAPPAPLAAFHQPLAGAALFAASAATAWAVAAGLELVPGALAAYRRPAA